MDLPEGSMVEASQTGSKCLEVAKILGYNNNNEVHLRWSAGWNQWVNLDKVRPLPEMGGVGRGDESGMKTPKFL